jgi:subtilisin-like proprotein convertase family protein
MDQVLFGNIVGDGSGQTIALIDAYHYPTALQDLQAFDAAFGLPDPPSFLQLDQNGGTNYPATDPAGAGSPNGTWELEESLVLQWAHAMAPKANLILIEANDNSNSNLLNASVALARSLPGVSVVSMSFGSNEFLGETSLDSLFTTPSGHTPVTFVASTGDFGAPGSYPAYSPNVVAVGGTSLSLSGGNYSSESGWTDGGGGISSQENKPAYQSPVTQSATRRTTPDISLVADPNTGVAIYDSWDFPGSPWLEVGGTSLSSPLFGAIVAVANQGRVLAGKPTLNGANDTLPLLYGMAWDAFHDVTSGSNGNSAAVAYDLVTGRGTPVLQRVVPELVGPISVGGEVYQDNNSSGSPDSGEPAVSGVSVFLDANNDGIREIGGIQTKSSGTISAPIPDNNTTGVSAPLTLSGLSGMVSSVKVTVNITHNNDSDLIISLIGPDNTTITLANRVGGSGNNFTSTTFDDAGFGLIAGGTAPFSGSFRPAPGALSAFTGKDPNGTWTLKVVDARNRTSGTLVSWSITVSTPNELATTTAADGSYLFSVVPNAFTLRETLPAGYIATDTTSRSLPNNLEASANNFGLFPTSLALNAGDTFHLWLDPTHTFLEIGLTDAASNPAYQVAVANLPSLTLTLAANSRVIVDFVNGSPLAPAVVIDGNNVPTAELDLVGQTQTFAMTDSTITPQSSGGVLTYQNLPNMTIYSSTVFFTGTLANLDSLTLEAGTTFYWM